MNRAIANSSAQALLICYHNPVGEIDVLFFLDSKSVEKLRQQWTYQIPPERKLNIPHDIADTVEGYNGTFAITMHGKFLPMHLNSKRETVQSLPRFKFPQRFCLSANEKHFPTWYESYSPVLKQDEYDESSDDDSEWEYDERSAFDALL